MHLTEPFNGQPGRPRILCVDDEPQVLEGLRDALHRSFDVRVATSGSEGLEILELDPGSFAIVISDMRMPQMRGADFLRLARLVAPDAVRMLLTGHADLEEAIRAVNGARLFRFLTKPCDSQELMRACAAALGQHHLQTAERVLLQETLRGSVQALAEVLALTNPAAFGRASRVKDLAGEIARELGLSNWWEVEVAATLAQIGAVTLPQSTAEKLYAGAPLSEDETAMVARIPQTTRQLLSNIPRLGGVIEILDAYTAGLDDESPEAPEPQPEGARVLRIAVDYDQLESSGASNSVALGALESRNLYDQPMLDALAKIIGISAAPVSELELGELRTGMTLADDVRSIDGGLLIARGQQVSDRLIERLSNLGDGSVREPLRVYATQPSG